MLYFCLGWSVLPGLSQGLELAEVLQKAEQQSPLQAQRNLWQSQKVLQLENVQTMWMPRLDLQGRLSWQSDVVTFPELGGSVSFPEIPKTQYNLSLNLNQALYDGGQSRYLRTLTEASFLTKEKELAAQLFSLKPMLTQLYFGIVLLDRQQQVVESSQEVLAANYKVVASGVKNGVVLQSELEKFERQQASLQQQWDELQGQKAALVASLKIWVGEDISVETEFALPEVAENQASQRPELALFDAQQGMARLQAESLGAQRLPKVGAFAQGGLGRPNPFNFLEVNTSPFFMAGVQFNWNIWDWKRTQRDQQNLAIQENLIEVYREQHQDQVALQVAQEEAEIETMRRLLEQDTRLIALQESILSRVNTQLQNGTVKPSDYLQEVEALTQSKLQQQIHEVRLRQSEVERAIHQGKY